MSEWAECTFCDLFAEDTKNGVFKSNGVPNIEANLIGMGALFHNDFIREYNEDKLSLTSDEVERFGVHSGDLLFGRRSLVESGAGKASLVVSASKPTVFESSIIRVRLDTKKADPRFYAYYFRTGVGRGRVFAIVNGAAVKGIRSSDLQKIRVHLPPLPTQRRIADILSAYDDLIENNRRRIEILEETARTLYRKMFVVEAKPEWKKCYLSDVVDICSGGTPSTKNDEYWNGGVPFFGPSDVTNFAYVYDTEKNISEVGLKARRLTLFPKDTVFITARGTVGKVNLIQRPMAMNQSCFALIAKNPISQFFLYYALATKGPSQFRCVAKGSVFEAIGTAEFACIPFVVPAKRLIDEFTNTVDPMLQQMAMLSRQNAKLAAARDLLLPRLMSGKLSVFAAEPLRRDEEVVR